MWLILGSISLFVVLSIFIRSVLMRTTEEELVAKFSSTNFRNMLFTAFITLSLSLTVAVFFIDKFAEKKQYQSLEYNLKSILSTTQGQLKSWIKFKLNILEDVGKNKELVALVEKLLLVSEDRNSLKNSPLQSQIRQFFKSRESELNHIGSRPISRRCWPSGRKEGSCARRLQQVAVLEAPL